MKYCLVSNNQIIKGPQELPQNSEKVSNFNLLSNEELKVYGWLPYTLIDNKGNDQILVNSSIQILENEIIETKNYRNYTQNELDQMELDLLNQKWSQIRQKRNRLLNQSDWTQINDTPVNKISWANYRNELRNIPQNFNNPDLVVWPIPPTN